MRNSLNAVFLLMILVVFYNCNRGPYAATNKAYKRQVKGLARQLTNTPPADSIPQVAAKWVGTTNFNLRKPTFVVIHHTAQNSCDQTLKTFTLPRTSVSAHYVICKDGTLHHMLNDYLRAWHAGSGRWGTQTDVNSASIGIEIDNNGFENFTEQQLLTLMQLLQNLKKAYTIPTANFIGHFDVAPTRKVDPNVNFPWKRLADAGFGLWWSDTTNIAVPQTFNALQALRIIGYDVKDSVAAIKAFKRKFLQQEGNGTFSEDDRKIVYALYRKTE